MNAKDKLYKELTSNIDDWDIGMHTAYHNSSCLGWWIANGLLFFKQEGYYSASLGLKNWLKLWFWIKEAKRLQAIKKIQNSKS